MPEKPSHGFRKVASIDPAKASAFVALNDVPVAVSPAAVPEPSRPSLAAVVPEPSRPTLAAVAPGPVAAPRTRRKTLRRADGRELRKQTIYFDPVLSTSLAVYCAQTGKDISEVVGAAVAELLARQGR